MYDDIGSLLVTHVYYLYSYDHREKSKHFRKIVFDSSIKKNSLKSPFHSIDILVI